MLLSKRISALMLGLLLGVCLVAGGCTAAKKPMTTPAPQPDKQPRITTSARTSSQILAEKSAAEASKVSGVNKATAFVSVKTIYIGLDVNSNLGKQQVADLEKMVLDRVKKMESSYTVVVTSDVDTVTRIKKVSQGLAQGKPISSFTAEMKDINSRMMPRTK